MKTDIITYQNQRILTTKQLAAAYKTTQKVISKNFTRNIKRYQEGKHYYTLSGDDKIAFISNCRQIDDGSKRARTLYLWTEKGAFMHAKSINTDDAWELYEKLVDHYFTVNDAVNKPCLPSDPNEILKLIVQANENVSKRVTAIEQDNIVMKEQMSTINDVIILSAEHWEEVKKVVMERVHHITANVSEQRKLYRGLWKAMQERYNVTKCKQIKDKDYADAIAFINNWEGVS